MLSNFNRLAASVSVAALTLGVTVAALPAQKAFAQLVGAGTGSIIDLADSLRINGNRYVVTGSGAGRTAFANGDIDFVATSSTPGSYNFATVVVNEANINLVIPYNVPDFNGQLTLEQACGIVGGTITNWNEVGGPDLPVSRVIRGDAGSGDTGVHSTGFTEPFCGFAIIAGGPNGPASFPNPNPNDIVVPVANDPFNSGDDNNSGSYGLGLIIAVQNTPGAIGYVEDVLAINRGIPLVTAADTGGTTIAVGPTYVVFRGIYDTQEQADAALAVCLTVTDTDILQSKGYALGADAVPGGNFDACSNIAGPDDGQ